ncbi:MAG: hypothetical protein A2096_13800 [Spirochaetes bacterium GWF1_41_5]|nr:MAG: hypothetical protein A2096_13800 [Spirochaetes bacterium GWF1_41_5]
MNEILATRVTRQLKNFSLIFGIDPALNITHFAELAGLSALENKTECAFISIEPSTGYISAMIGGSGFSYNNQMNRAVQMYRQIGSIMKPFVYAAAIDTKKITAATLFNDTPIAFENPDGSLYIPQNYSGKYYGYIRARTALQKSINATTLQVLELATIEKTREYCSKMFRSLTAEDQEKKFPYNMTMGLGSGIFSPLELATAYAVFANDGKEVIPLSIRYITDRDGKILRNLEEEFYGDRIPSQVIDKATAFIAADIMRNVLEPGGTAYNENLIKEFEHPSGGKTGTSGNWRDAWFAGFNKYLSTVIWLGYDDSRLSLGKGRAGGTLAAPVWIKYNRDVLMNKKNYPFEKPESVIEAEICTDSGKLPGPRCRRTMTEYFLPGTVPEEFCDFHSRENLQEMEFAETIRNMKKSDRPDNDDKEKRRRFRTPKSGTMNSNTGIDFSSFW